MQLGAFSVSLAVKDLAASRQFYEKLGFQSFAGNPAQNWLILKNGDTVIGLFQGMFPKNILTFNPGWDSNATTASVNAARAISRSEVKPTSRSLLRPRIAAGSRHRTRYNWSGSRSSPSIR